MLRVLYVDDEESLLELAKELMGSQDFIIETATSAKFGLKRINEGGIDVVVSDYQMPDTDGLAFLRELKRNGIDLPFILFTGKGREEVVIQALNEGVDSYIQKGGSPVPLFTELTHRIISAAERHHAMFALQQSEARLMHAEKVAGFGHWELHLDNNIMMSSSGALAIYGTERVDRPYGEVKKMPLPEYREQLDRSMEDLISGSDPYDIEFKIKRTTDGKIIDIHSKAEYDPLKRIVFGVIQDVTDLKKAEIELSLKNEELLASNAQISATGMELKAVQHQFALAMDLAKLVNWEMDLKKNIFIFNDRFYALYGTTAEKEGGYIMAVDAYTERFVHPDDQKSVSEVIRRNLTSEVGIDQMEHRIVRRDGQVRDIVVRIEVVRDKSGRPTWIYGANQDFTERKQAEAALGIAMRKLNLLNDITMHDITNQLVSLLGNLELLENLIKDDGAMSKIKKVKRSGHIIMDQIRFSKEYQDMGSMAPKWQRVASIVQGMEHIKDINDLHISEEAQKLWIYADPMLSKVYQNLIENTLRYGDHNSSIRIDCEPTDQGVILIYEDDGPGIPEEDKQRIFEKGFGKGTGLGLFLTREILAITGITIKETGQQNHGVRFEMSIPSQMVKSKSENERACRSAW